MSYESLSSVVPGERAVLRLEGVSHGYGERRVLDAVDLVVGAGERVGLIGENGAGKSTLLRVLGGIEVPLAGRVSRPASLGVLAQELAHPPSTTVDAVLDEALAPVCAAERELEAAAQMLGAGDGAGPHGDAGPRDAAGADGRDPDRADPAARYAVALERAEALEVWAAEARRDELLAAYGLADLPRERRLDAVSGGQRSRLALVALLLARPTALLLDEPTNHLDETAVAHLRTALLAWRGPVVFASHDRAFLDEVATAVVDVDPRIAGDDHAAAGVHRYGGGFSDYLVEKAAERARWQQRHAREQAELAQLAESVATTSRRVAPDRGMRDNEKMGYGRRGNRVAHQVSRRVRNARGRLDLLESRQVPPPPPPLRFAGIMPAAAEPAVPTGVEPAVPTAVDPVAIDAREPLVVLHDVSVPGRLAGRAEPIRWSLRPGDRLLVTGGNGAGKSTLLALLAGDAVPGAAGSVRRRDGLTTGILRQDAPPGDPQLSPRRAYERALGIELAERVPLADTGLFAPADLDRPLGRLSIGQQRRLALALVIARPPELLLLDEPTNHLSLALAAELEAALADYPGAVVLATHDRWLRQRWRGAVLAL